jgi:hypothetical protein
MTTATLSPERTAYRTLIAEIAAKAKDKLPECNGRVEKAVKLVLAGDVAVLDDGRAVVASFTDPTKTYAVEHSVCTCQDFPRAPHGFCAHRLAVAMARRAREVMPSQPEASSPAAGEATAAAPVASAPLGEAPASVNCHIMLEGRQVQVTLRDTDEARLLERLAAVLRQYPTPAAPQPAPRPQGQERGWCSIHNCAMKENHKDGRTWFSHRNPDGDGWCKGRR